MDGQDPRNQAVLLRDDSMGVFTESTPRKIQARNGRNYICSINPDWLEQLEMADQGYPTLHSFSLGVYPVIVQNPAIIIQPADILEG